MAKFFIDRPIFAWVIAIFIIAAGIFGIQKLPISQYPSVAAPTITLTATYPGASAQVMEDSLFCTSTCAKSSLVSGVNVRLTLPLPLELAEVVI